MDLFEDLKLQALRGIEDLQISGPTWTSAKFLKLGLCISQTHNGLQHSNNPRIDQMLFHVQKKINTLC